MTQREEILRWIRVHGSITRAQAANLHIYELSARICELQNEGWTCDRKTITGKNAYGRKWRVTSYSNPVRQDQSAERYAEASGARKKRPFPVGPHDRSWCG